MFCVECGKEAGEDLSETGLCHACFLEKNTFASIPENVDFEVCVHCRSRKRGEVWVPPHVFGAGDRLEPLVASTVEDAVAVDRRVEDATVDVRVVAEDTHARNFTVEAVVSGVAENVPFTETHTGRARIKNATCVRCSRIMGGYYESIVQIRAHRRDLTRDELREARAIASRVIDRIVTEGDWNAFVLKDEEIHGGLDIEAGTINSGRNIAKAIAAAFGSRVKEHAKIAGQRDGQDFYRVTFALRLPEYRVGDVVVLDDAPLLVTGMNPKTVTLRLLPSGGSRTLDHDGVANAPVVPRADARDAVVVTRSDAELEVLDPWSFQTVSVLKPADAAADGETVPVVRWSGQLFVLPDGDDAAESARGKS